MTKKFKAAHTSVGISNNFPILFFFLRGYIQPGKITETNISDQKRGGRAQVPKIIDPSFTWKRIKYAMGVVKWCFQRIISYPMKKEKEVDPLI